jgi:hypothetical protein
MKKLKVICKLTRVCETQDGFYSFLFNGYEMKVPCDTVVFYAQDLKDAMASIQLQEIEIINTSWEN